MTHPTPPPGSAGTTPDQGSGTDELGEEAVARLADALAAEHAAIFAYGPIGVRLDDDLAGAAREAEQEHRDRRDALLLLLAGAGQEPPAAEPSYLLPFAVADADDALRLAVLVEERVAALWRAVLAPTTGDLRATALAALLDAAVRATGWREAAGATPLTVPFPGAR